MKKVLFLPLLLVLGMPFAFADYTEITIEPDMGSGSAIDDCTETQYGCYIPGVVTVDVESTIIFSNTDNAAHTWSAGSSDEGPTGEFDTSMVMPGNSYEWTADVLGEIPYFCMVHPWMDGLIIVGDTNSKPSAISNPVSSPSGISDDIEITELKNKINALETENQDLKQQIITLEGEIEQLKDIIINALKEIYAWMP